MGSYASRKASRNAVEVAFGEMPTMVWDPQGDIHCKRIDVILGVINSPWQKYSQGLPW